MVAVISDGNSSVEVKVHILNTLPFSLINITLGDKIRVF
jgi:hypothetical protein